MVDEKIRMVKVVIKRQSKSKVGFGYSVEFDTQLKPLMEIIERGVERFCDDNCDGDENGQFGVAYITTMENDVLFSWEDYRFNPFMQDGEQEKDWVERVVRAHKDYIKEADVKILEYADALIESFKTKIICSQCEEETTSFSPYKGKLICGECKASNAGDAQTYEMAYGSD